MVTETIRRGRCSWQEDPLDLGVPNEMTASIAIYECAKAGCLVIGLPVSITIIGKVSKACPKNWVIDTLLGEKTRCMVMGSKADCEKARRAVGIETPIGEDK